jgi:cystathionine gamma-synthase
MDLYIIDILMFIRSQLGADIVFHSGTKYLGGHSDVLLGLVTISPWTERGQEIAPRLKEVQVKAGAVAAPFDSWLTLRGLRTLHVRVDRACENALSLATFLDAQKSVQVVHYPGLKTHPQHAIAKRQMKNQFGGVMSFEMKTESEAMAVAGALRMAQRATSLGGTETLVEHRASIEPPNRVVSPPGLLRVSVGIEHIDDLMDDFKTALAIAKEVVA